MTEPKIVLTDAATAGELAVISDGLRDYNTSRAGHDDYKRLAILSPIRKAARSSAASMAAAISANSRSTVFLPESLRRYRLGSRLLAMAEEEARRRGCSRITLNTLEIQAHGFTRSRAIGNRRHARLRPARRDALRDDEEA